MKTVKHNNKHSLITKHIGLIVISYLALQLSVFLFVYISEKILPWSTDFADVQAILLLILAPILLIPVYLAFNLITLIPYLRSVKYNFAYAFLSIFTSSLLIFISYFVSNNTIVILLQIISLLTFFIWAWIFKKFEKSKE